MKIAFLSDTYSPQMGYIQNVLPKFVAKNGHEVHLITTRLLPYYHISEFERTYRSFASGAATTETGSDGVHLHRLPHRQLLGYPMPTGMVALLRQMKPDVVQCFGAAGWLHLIAAAMKPLCGYTLFTGCHTHASIFPLATARTPWWQPRRICDFVKRTIPGRLISLMTEKCYTAAPDCRDIAVRFYGVQENKAVICPIGIDTDVFYPATSTADLADRAALRASLGFGDDDLVCIYTGRFTEDKNPLLLGRAVERLRALGVRVCGLFIGAGAQEKQLSGIPNCTVLPFAKYWELGRYYRAADLAVWPTQESMSMLDAAACGLPVIANNTAQIGERIDGNGAFYRLGDVDDLAVTIRQFIDREYRVRLGAHGAEKMRRSYSWQTIAELRLTDYASSLGRADQAPTSPLALPI